MSIDWTNIFKDIGCCVRQANLFNKTVVPTDITAESVKKVAQFDSGAERLAILSEMLSQDQSNIDAIAKMGDSVIDAAKSYITTKVGPVDFGSVYSSLDELLAEMETLMTGESESVDANGMSATTPVANDDNYGTGACGTVTPNQMAKTQNFRLECYQEAMGEIGALFHVYSGLDGLLDKPAEAAVEYDTGNSAGGVKFTIANSVVQESYDQANQMDSWYVAGAHKEVWWENGALRPPNTAVDGTVYVTLEKFGSPGTLYVHWYMDAARTILVAEGEAPYGGGITTVQLFPAELNGNPSGIAGDVDVTWSINDTDIEIIPNFEYRVGDAFTFSTTSDDAGTFQSFFRDRLGRSLPANGVGQETISDAWAE